MRPTGRNAERAAMEKLLSDLQGHSTAWPFLQPVNAKEVADYYEVILHPMGTSLPPLKSLDSECRLLQI